MQSGDLRLRPFGLWRSAVLSRDARGVRHAPHLLRPVHRGPRHPQQGQPRASHRGQVFLVDGGAAGDHEPAALQQADGTGRDRRAGAAGAGPAAAQICLDQLALPQPLAHAAVGAGAAGLCPPGGGPAGRGPAAGGGARSGAGARCSYGSARQAYACGGREEPAAEPGAGRGYEPAAGREQDPLQRGERAARQADGDCDGLSLGPQLEAGDL
mmetsp:Transcript_19738/g.75681  ORF Transcript_19738/g.75681 Transcript_19738/m.75681 type:complete len:212 (-) Transcript_19738:747-1382(-)